MAVGSHQEGSRGKLFDPGTFRRPCSELFHYFYYSHAYYSHDVHDDLKIWMALTL